MLRTVTAAALIIGAGALLALAFPALSTPIKPTTLLLDIRGGGWIGYRLGFVGALLMLIAQTYSLKPLLTARSRISPEALLDIHCYLTLAGGLLILIHSGFPVPALTVQPFDHIHLGRGLEGLVGVQWLAAWLVIFLMASGTYGKYLYKRRPPKGLLKPLRKWLVFHIALSGALYVTGMIHLVLVLVIKHVPAI